MLGREEQPLKKFGQLRFFGQQEKFEEMDIFYFNLKSAW